MPPTFSSFGPTGVSRGKQKTACRMCDLVPANATTKTPVDRLRPPLRGATAGMEGSTNAPKVNGFRFLPVFFCFATLLKILCIPRGGFLRHGGAHDDPPSPRNVIRR
ncbi:hypothetical protein LX36DRAFT_650471 [Colletotrichum falcatum]|nr:hypothetical protein LX36DRAFT_650471 [Colletotrichum falcatum]